MCLKNRRSSHPCCFAGSLPSNSQGSLGLRGYSCGVQRRPRSRTRTLRPRSASRQAVIAPPNPLPITMASYVRLIVCTFDRMALPAVEECRRSLTRIQRVTLPANASGTDELVCAGSTVIAFSPATVCVNVCRTCHSARSVSASTTTRERTWIWRGCVNDARDWQALLEAAWLPRRSSSRRRGDPRSHRRGLDVDRSGRPPRAIRWCSCLRATARGSLTPIGDEPDGRDEMMCPST